MTIYEQSSITEMKLQGKTIVEAILKNDYLFEIILHIPPWHNWKVVLLKHCLIQYSKPFPRLVSQQAVGLLLSPLHWCCWWPELYHRTASLLVKSQPPNATYIAAVSGKMGTQQESGTQMWDFRTHTHTHLKSAVSVTRD